MFALVLTGLVAALMHVPLLAGIEAKTSDDMMRWRYLLEKRLGDYRPDGRLVLAAIDERSMQSLGAWPFPRSMHGQFMALMATEKPKVVGWDILFTETKNPAGMAAPATNGPSEDDVFVQGAALIPQLVTAAQTTDDPQPELTEAELLPTRPIKNVTGDTSRMAGTPNAVLPFPALRKAGTFGFVDAPGSVRRAVPLAVNVGGKILPSLTLQILCQFWDIDPDRVVIRLGKEVVLPRPDGRSVHVPIDEAGLFTINYRAQIEDFRAISYVQLATGLSDKVANRASEDATHVPPLKDNIVVVGYAATGFDNGPTPLQGVTPLVVTHLNALNNILENDFLRPEPAWIWMPTYALFLFGVGSVMLRVGLAPMIPVGLGACAVLMGTAFAAMWINLLVPVAVLEIGILLLAGAVPMRRFFGEEREKKRIQGAMSAYLSEKVMAKVLEHPDNLKLGGEKQAITVMFCDIRGFTKFCDERDPAETVEVLNAYMEAMTQVVFRHDGTIDKYIGDCIMAFWNAPEAQPDHAQRAVSCAVEMREALRKFHASRAARGEAPLECGIGIHTGEAVVGNMGSSLKRNYTALGSTVNMAARLESMTKHLGVRILISQATLNELTDAGLTLEDYGEQEVAGFAQPVHVYAVGAA